MASNRNYKSRIPNIKNNFQKTLVDVSNYQTAKNHTDGEIK